MITVVLASSLSILAGIGFNFIRSRIPALILFLSGQAAIGLAWYLAIVTTHPEIAEEQPFSIPTLFAWWFAFIFAPGAIGFGVTSLARDFLRKKR